METSERHVVTIVAETAVESRLVEDVKRLGAKGYTVGRVRGEGTTGQHLQDLSGPSVRLETIVSEAVADRILEHLATAYFGRFAVVAWVTSARVLRSERF